MSLPIVRTTLLRIDIFSRRCGLHPDLVRRFVTLGLIEPAAQTGDEMWFSSAQVGRIARMQRLRSDLALNYSAVGLVLDLLDRIEELERASGRGVSRSLEN